MQTDMQLPKIWQELAQHYFPPRLFLRGLMQTDEGYLKYGIFRRILFEGADADRKNPPKNSVEAVPAESQKESAPKFLGGSSRRISKRIHPLILWRQFPPNLKKNPPQN